MIQHWVASWQRLMPADRWLVIRMTVLLAAVRFALLVTPFGSLRKLLDWFAFQSRTGEPADNAYRERIAWATATAGRHLLQDAPCLTQALAVQLLLHRRGCPAELRIGVAKDQHGNLIAHAWVESEGEIVIGGSREAVDEYTRLSTRDGVHL